MKTISLRFGEQFAPECGTIAEHQKVISEKEFVWYGKLGTPVSIAVAKEILSQDSPAILLIRVENRNDTGPILTRFKEKPLILNGFLSIIGIRLFNSKRGLG